MTSKSAILKKLFLRNGTAFKLMFPMTTLHARILEDLGYETFYVGAAAVLGPILGRVDNGTITLTESVQVSRYFADAVKIPVITDTDACFGGIFQVERATREFIQAGVAGINIEDQPFLGKRMGAISGKEVISLGDAVAKYRVASDVRDALDPDFQIIARCDALTAVNANGVAETIDRLLAYKDAGADVLYVEGPRSFEELLKVREAVPGPLMCTGYNLPRDLTDEEAGQMGVSAIIYVTSAKANMQFMWWMYSAVQERGYGAFQEFFEKCPVDPTIVARLRDQYMLGDVKGFEAKYLAVGSLGKYGGESDVAYNSKPW